MKAENSQLAKCGQNIAVVKMVGLERASAEAVGSLQLQCEGGIPMFQGQMFYSMERKTHTSSFLG